VIGLGALMTLARFSEAFLIVRTQQLGLALALAPLALVVMNIVYTAAAYPAGLAADRGRRRALLGWGLGALISADLALAWAPSLPVLFVGIALWGLHMGLTQGLLSAMVADAAPETLRGTAFGAFHFVSGLALLAASLIAGWLWEAFGAAWAFYAGAAFAGLGLAGLLALKNAGALPK
jgi:MFS family permease